MYGKMNIPIFTTLWPHSTKPEYRNWEKIRKLQVMLEILICQIPLGHTGSFILSMIYWDSHVYLQTTHLRGQETSTESLASYDGDSWHSFRPHNITFQNVCWPTSRTTVSSLGISLCFGMFFIRLVNFFHLNLFSGFFEERAILLGKLGRHEQALSIYVHILKDNKMAQQWVCCPGVNPRQSNYNEISQFSHSHWFFSILFLRYCKMNFDPDREGNKDVSVTTHNFISM